MEAAAFFGVIAGQPQAPALAPFLQRRFPVVGVGIGEQGGKIPQPMGVEPGQHRLQAPRRPAADVIDRPDQGLAAFRQHGGAAAALHQGHRSMPQHGRKIELLGQGRQPAITHQLGSHGRPAPHGQIGLTAAQKLRGRQAQHRVAEKLEPLVIAATAGRGVGEGFIQRRQPVPIPGDAGQQGTAIQEGGELGETPGLHRARGAKGGESGT